MQNPLVSICCQTYNHKNYISQAIDGFLMQKTNFPFEVLLRDDASTDGTSEIVKEYSEKYPNIINPLIYAENQWQKGVSPFRDNVKRATGKYIAICEGDDYWTDPLKLQKQVDFLEGHEEFSLVCHDALIINEMTNRSTLFFGLNKKKQICSTPDTLNVHFCPTASIVLRREAILPLSNFDISAVAGDHLLVQLASLNGLLYRMFDVMSVYRKTAVGASELNGGKKLVPSLENRISTLNHLNRVSNNKYQKAIKIENLLIKNRINLLQSKSKIKTTILRINRKVLSYVKKFL